MAEFLKNNSTYAAVLAGFLIGLPVMRSSRKKGITIPLKFDILKCLAFSAVSVISVLLFASLEGLLGGKGFQLGAVSTYGVYIIAPLLLLLIFRRERGFVFDDFAIYASLSLIFQRIRCITAGCCMGKTVGSGAFRWPVREAEIIFYLIVLILFVSKRRTGNKTVNSRYLEIKGMLFPLLMICYGCLRFLLEFLREGGSASIFHMAHLWSLLTVIAGLGICAEIKRNNTSKGKDPRS